MPSGHVTAAEKTNFRVTLFITTMRELHIAVVDWGNGVGDRDFFEYSKILSI